MTTDRDLKSTLIRSHTPKTKMLAKRRAAAASAKKAVRKAYKKKPYTVALSGGSVARSLSPFSPNFVHKFRRMMPEITITNSGMAGTPGLFCDIAQTFFAIGGVVADDPSGLGASAPVQFGLTCIAKFDQIINFADFGNLFNEYRLDNLQIEFIPMVGPSYAPGGPGTQAASQLPTLYRRYDPNDSIMEPNWLSIAQAADCSTHYFGDGKSKVFSGRPMPATPQYVAGVASGYGYNAGANMWLDTSAPSSAVEHYHSKFWFRGWPSTNQIGLAFRVQPVAYFSCRRCR